MPLDFIHVSSLRPTHLIDPTLVDGEFPGLGLALIRDVVVLKAEHGVRVKQKSRFKFLPWPRFEPRTSQSTTRTLPLDYGASLLLVESCMSSVAPPRKSSADAVSTLPRKRNLLFPARGLPLGSAVPFLLLALRHGMGFLSLSAKHPLIAPSPSSLPSRPLCLTEAGLGALLSRQS